MKKIWSILLLTLISTTSMAIDKVTEVGKIEYNQKSNTFIFYFVKENSVKSIVIKPKENKEIEMLKSFSGKIVVMSGEIKPYVQSKEGFQYREELHNPKLKELNADLLKINSKKMIAQYNLDSHEKKNLNANKGGGLIVINNLPDRPTNAVVEIAGVIIGIATGPIALVPAAAYLIEESLTK